MNTAGKTEAAGEAVEGGLTSEGILQVHQLQQEPSVLLLQSGREFFVCLVDLGFEVLDSKANFLFAKNNKIGGEELYLKLKEKGILVRHFTKDKICEYNRITIGTKEQMEAFVKAVKEIIGEKE